MEGKPNSYTKKGKSKTTVNKKEKPKGNKNFKKDKGKEKEKNKGNLQKKEEVDYNKLNQNKINNSIQIKETNNQDSSNKMKEKEIDINKQIKLENNRDNKTMISNKPKMNLDNIENIKEQTNIEEFYFLDRYSSINDIVKFKINDNYKDDINEIFKLIDHNKINNSSIGYLFKKNDFIEKYEFIYIQYNDKQMNFLLPKCGKSNNSENDILNEIKNSFYSKNIENLFNIDFNSANKKY